MRNTGQNTETKFLSVNKLTRATFENRPIMHCKPLNKFCHVCQWVLSLVMSNGNFTSVYTKEYLLLLAKFSVENLDAE